MWFWCCIYNLWVCVNQDTFDRSGNASFKLCMDIVILGSSFFFGLVLEYDEESCCSRVLILYVVIQGDYLRACHNLFTQSDGRYPLFMSARTCVQAGQYPIHTTVTLHYHFSTSLDHDCENLYFMQLDRNLKVLYKCAMTCVTSCVRIPCESWIKYLHIIPMRKVTKSFQ
jgi:hypothetical protein